MTLKAECGSPGEALQAIATLRSVTKLGGSVDWVAPESCRTTARSSRTSAKPV